MSRSVSKIAYEIRQVWKAPYFGAVPYLHAMCALESVRDNYGSVSGRSAVLYFLFHATSWRGPDARRIKAELKELLK